jgi:hypothetical protein
MKYYLALKKSGDHLCLKVIGDQKYIYPFHLGSVWILKVYHLWNKNLIIDILIIAQFSEFMSVVDPTNFIISKKSSDLWTHVDWWISWNESISYKYQIDKLLSMFSFKILQRGVISSVPRWMNQ